MTEWWRKIPHLDRVQWPILLMHTPEFSEEMWRFAPILRADLDKDPAYRGIVREALDYVLARGTTPDEWLARTSTWFFDQQELDEYLMAFRDYLFADRPELIYPPDSERVLPEADTETHPGQDE
ncbi:hypothetical protein [Nocardia sp. SSK8]|uniref:hypothetical protein n=1 Tax=Nocardia sp. SSK8 TaxID=3120154 RepID=UPI00300AE353